MLEEPRIEAATIDELGVISALAHEIWPHAFRDILSVEQLDFMLDLFYSQNSLIEQSTVKGHRFFFAKLNDRPVGFISLEPNYKGEKHTKIHKIYLLPETQGKGIGKLLIEHAEKFASENHNDFLILNVNRNNKAIYFYENLGFKIVKEEDISIGNGFLMEDYVMLKSLLNHIS